MVGEIRPQNVTLVVYGQTLLLHENRGPVQLTAVVRLDVRELIDDLGAEFEYPRRSSAVEGLGSTAPIIEGPLVPHFAVFIGKGTLLPQSVSQIYESVGRFSAIQRPGKHASRALRIACPRVVLARFEISRGGLV